MPAVRTPYRTSRTSRRRTPYSKTRYSGPRKSVRALASTRVPYDREVIESPHVGLGQGVRTRIRTFGHVQMVVGATGIFTGFLKPGSCYDPFGDIGTPQPNLFDVWKGVFGRYLVLGATVKMTIVSQSSIAAAVANGGTLVAYPSITSTAKTVLQDAASQPYAKTVLYGGAGADPKTLYFKLNHLKVLGKYGPLESLANGGLVGADPTTGQFMVLPIFYQSTVGTATSGNLTMEVEITQDVWFDKRLNVNDVIE